MDDYACVSMCGFYVRERMANPIEGESIEKIHRSTTCAMHMLVHSGFVYAVHIVINLSSVSRRDRVVRLELVPFASHRFDILETARSGSICKSC